MKIPWRRKRQPTPVFLPGKTHRQRSLEVYSPQGHKRVGHDLTIKQQNRLLGFLFILDKPSSKLFDLLFKICLEKVLEIKVPGKTR